MNNISKIAVATVISIGLGGTLAYSANQNAPVQAADKKEQVSEQVKSPSSNWTYRETKAKMDDTLNAYATVYSEKPVPDIGLGGGEYAQLHFQCVDKQHNVYVYFGSKYMVDSSIYGDVRVRIDDKPAERYTLDESVGNEALGAWGNLTAMALMGLSSGGETMLFEATPYREAPIVVEFDITGVDEVLGSLNKVCNV